MLIQNTNAFIKVRVIMSGLEKGLVNLVDDSTVKLVLTYRNHKVIKDCIISQSERDMVTCELSAEDLVETGNYNYQVQIRYENGIVKKSVQGSFYVSPSLDFTEEV